MGSGVDMRFGLFAFHPGFRAGLTCLANTARSWHEIGTPFLPTSVIVVGTMTLQEINPSKALGADLLKVLAPRPWPKREEKPASHVKRFPSVWAAMCLCFRRG